ncbi:NADP-dependent oxidoreductase domain-containing protein 1-like [Plakobranchus ocellatus]|uniref:NADP-dependent oxidoreductase domain-containing protein 1-like n=1 Tax=Plakobranchus ocellatus TaxID=259542 RepID=A0AAV4A9S3_9GAST|nr:NADP-dependent oxidoreductase domain-containing protein 1-like [Plakobranchus ocellatus]
MALVTRLQASSKQETTNDITRNLSSLQFESALTDEEKNLIPMRTRNHAISVTQCALITSAIDIFSRARDAKLRQINPGKQRSTHILQDESERDTLIVGIIGCGRLGSQIAHCLLTYGQLHPSKLQISTRRPETLEYLQHKGVECYFNNERLVSSAHVVIFCVLPSQMPGVCEDIKDHISSSLIMLCAFSSISLRRLRQMLGSSNVIQPKLHWKEDVSGLNYNHSLNVNMALESRDTVLGTCPIGVEKKDLVVSTDDKVAESIILAVVNMCTESSLTYSQTLTVIRAAVFGETHKKPLTCDRLTVKDFGLKESDGEKERSFPSYDLVEAYENGTPLLKILKENVSIKEAFVKKYTSLFEDYLHKRAYGQLP